jgi:adenylate cyclase
VAEHSPRKLAVILHADVVGSTALVQRNESVAHERMQDVFRRFSATIESYGGIAHEVRGDALVAEFARASDAVSAALAFQLANKDHNKGVTDDIRPEIRIGISLGEVVIADGTITGAGVVLAQRLEQLAEPGGVCIQGAAYETVPQRLPFKYESLGEQEVKGFEEPVRVYTVGLEDGQAIPPPDAAVRPDMPALELPDKPSIAVLPFTNMSGDPEQEYFSDGVTEDIITELSKFRSLFVIARNSSFSYKGRAVKVQEVSKDLGVQYVLEGSVRRAGNQVRVTAQLIEGSTGNHIWAERYDRELEDIFAVQDDVSRAIVTMTAGRLDADGAERAKRKPPEDINAYDLVLRGVQQLSRDDREAREEAIEFFKKALELAPEYVRAYGYLALSYFIDVAYMYAGTDHLKEGLKFAKRALALDVDDSLAHAAKGLILFLLGHDDEGISSVERSFELNPNDAEVLRWMGAILTYAGRPEEAVEYLRNAIRLNPFNTGYDTMLGFALYYCRRFEEAVEVLRKKGGIRYRWRVGYAAAALGQLGRVDEARAVAEEFVALRQAELREREDPIPSSTLELAREGAGRWRRAENLDLFLDGLRKAGLK